MKKECSTWTWITDNTRNIKHTSSTVLCDKDIAIEWYRFGGSAGTQLSATCIAGGAKCATHGVSWLNGNHPSVSEGKVIREVCFSYSSNCCYLRKDIEVANCGSFYIYKLVPTVSCSHRYCASDV